MFKVLSTAIIAFSFTQAAWTQVLDAKSAHREPGVSYKAYESRARIFNNFSRLSVDRNAVDSAAPFAKATLPAAAQWENETVMLERFKSFRDLRFLDDDSHNIKRRSTWLYPDDGCFARAALAVRNLTQSSVTAPSKVFVFGDLSVKSDNAIGGFVTWWYHVAPIVEVNGQKFVLDPAISPNAPLKLEEWLATMSTTPQNLEVAICNSGSYTPYSSCSDITDGKEESAEYDQKDYLGAEWSRLKQLGRDPEKELGDNPPWN